LWQKVRLSLPTRIRLVFLSTQAVLLTLFVRWVYVL
jgi:hypothetical protein